MSLDLPEFQLTTKTYDLMQEMVGMVRYGGVFIVQHFENVGLHQRPK